MNFDELLHIVRDEPVFATGLLLAGNVNERDVRKQLSRWAAAGKLIQLRKGLYTLSELYRKMTLHPFLIANHLVRGSYVTCESALSHYTLIPEGVPETISVCMSRPVSRETPLGWFRFQHLKPALFTGYRQVTVAADQTAFVAEPEKALLDLVYLRKGGDDPRFIESLRLQHLDQITSERLNELARQSGSPKLMRAAEVFVRMIAAEGREYRIL